MSRLHVLMNGEPIGLLDGHGRGLRLIYDRVAAADPGFVPLSLSMPATQTRWRGEPITRWLTGLLPERESVVMRWRARFSLTDLHPESLLAHIGEDVAGAAQFVRPERLEPVTAHEGHVVELSDSVIAGIVRAAKQDLLPYDPAAQTGRFSLAGAQVKFALQRTPNGWALPSGAQPSTHVFKPAMSALADQDVTEVVSMRTAALLGLPVAEATVAEFDGERVICVERYDRIQLGGRWWRVHQEDLCQATGGDPRLKYETQGGPGVATCGRLIREHCGQPDVEVFARAIMVNYLIRGSDAHARNYSLLLTPANTRLAPLYDLNTTLSFGDHWAPTLAMHVGGEDRLAAISRGNWALFAAELHLDGSWVHDELVRLSASLPDALDTVCAQPGIATVAGRTGAVLRDRAADWCREAARRST